MLACLLLTFALPLGGPSSPDPDAERPFAVRCQERGHPISPMIYGVAYNARRENGDPFVWDLSPGARRWGGNPTSRYNWRMGNAWNTGADWYFMNVDYVGEKADHWRIFLEGNRQHQAASALTIPLLGWVAKDTSSYGFPVSVVGPQRSTEPHHPDAGDGYRPDGQSVNVIDRRRTSIPFTPADAAAWVTKIRELERAAGGPLVNMYILDNEPMLWHVTHRDVRTSPVSYDELLEKTLAFGSAIREAHPNAVIAGPAEWGWPAYFFSAVDAEAGFSIKPDRRLHGDVPLLAWYLRQLRKHERTTGRRILDVLDVHYYPQAKGVFLSSSNTPEAAATRLRATRSLWDPTYKDESWIADAVQLLPRLERLVKENYPGLGIAIGEYNFGGEDHMSGALALTEALGRFGQSPLMRAAFYWTYPPWNSPTFHAFRAFRNFDGKGGQFGEISVPVASRQPSADVSAFASRSRDGSRVVVVVTNQHPSQARRLELDLSRCGAAAGLASYRYSGGPAGIEGHKEAALRGGKVVDHLPPYSISVYSLSTVPRPPSVEHQPSRDQAACMNAALSWGGTGSSQGGEQRTNRRVLARIPSHLIALTATHLMFRMTEVACALLT